MQLPRFLLADHSEHPEDIFIVHTQYPRFVINLKDDEIEFLEEISDKDQEDLTTEMQNFINEASAFYDEEVAKYE